jgi:ssRNA-specific RNase YbeY (16S rRNA maturation enzyme)
MKNYDYWKKSQITDISNFSYWLHQKGVGIYASLGILAISITKQEVAFVTTW